MKSRKVFTMGSLQCVLVCFIAMFLSHVAARSYWMDKQDAQNCGAIGAHEVQRDETVMIYAKTADMLSSQGSCSLNFKALDTDAKIQIAFETFSIQDCGVTLYVTGSGTGKTDTYQCGSSPKTWFSSQRSVTLTLHKTSPTANAYGFQLKLTAIRDCTTGEDNSSVFVKTSHSIIFHFEEHGGNFSFIEHFTFERTQNGRREEICRFDIMVDLGGDLPYEDCSSHSNRTSVILIDADKRYIIVDVIISNAEKADNGTYMIFGRRSGRTKCFTVFILDITTTLSTTDYTPLCGITQTFSQNNTPVAVVGGVLGLALLAALVVIVVLLRRGGNGAASATNIKTADLELQNTGDNYEILNHRNEASPTYDELTGIAVTEDKNTSRATPTEKDYYENMRETDTQ